MKDLRNVQCIFLFTLVENFELARNKSRSTVTPSGISMSLLDDPEKTYESGEIHPGVVGLSMRSILCD